MSFDGTLVKMFVSANKTYASRSVTVKVTDTKTNQYVTLTIKQDPAPTPTNTPTPTPTKKPAQCVVSFDVGEGNGQQFFENKTLRQGATFGDSLSKTPGAPAYKHFTGWYTTDGKQYKSSSVVPSQATLKLRARYAYNTYTITFDPNANATGAMIPMNCTCENSYNLSSNTFQRLGYAFDEWNTKADGSGTSYKNGESVKNLVLTHKGTITLYAQWKPAYCSVSFDVGEGEGAAYIGKRSFQRGTKFGSTFPLNPGAPKHKHFAGWYDKDGNLYTNASTVPDKASLELTARYDCNSYMIVFDPNGIAAGEMTAMKCLYGTSYYLTINGFRRTGYTFIEWNTKPDGSGKTYTDGQSVSDLVVKNNGSITLYARWEEAYCSVRFDVGEGFGHKNDFASKRLRQGSRFGDVFPKNVGAPVYKHLSGWYTKGGVRYTEESIVPVRQEIKLYARFDYNSYWVYFDSNGGSGMMEPQEYSCGDDITLPKHNFTKTDCYFSGWNTKADGTGIPYSDQDVVKNLVDKDNGAITLYAQWIPIFCDVYYYGEDADGKPVYGKKTLKMKTPLGDTLPKIAREDFVGWYTIDGTEYTSDSLVPIARSLTLYARYNSNEDTFFLLNPRYESTKYVHEPKNSGVEGAMNVTKEQYMEIYRERGLLFKEAMLSAGTNNPTQFFIYVEENKDNPWYKPSGLPGMNSSEMDTLYITNVKARAALLTVGINAVSKGFPTAATLYDWYLFGGGEKRTFNATELYLRGSTFTALVTYETNYLKDQMTRCLVPGQTITFVDKDGANNKISFTTNTFTPSNKDEQKGAPHEWMDLDGFAAIKEGSYGISATCKFDGTTYTMDVYFYLQDCYDFYYKAGDWNSQSYYWLGSCYLDELAYLVAFDSAAPYKVCGLYHKQLTWEKE